MGCGHYNYSINAKQNEIDANQAKCCLRAKAK